MSGSGTGNGSHTAASTFGWAAIARLGLVQAAIGAIVVLTTSTLNRVMVVELALPALLPGLLLALHHVVQISRPRMGHGSDTSPRRTPWILGGMSMLSSGGVLAALATVWMATERSAGIALAVLAFVLIGLGVAAAGTSLLALLAQRVAAGRRAAAATTVWIMMIAGFVVTAGTAGHFLDPYSPQRLLEVAAVVCIAALALAVIALAGLEGRRGLAARAAPRTEPGADPAGENFRSALRQLWAEPVARRFTVFVFVSMLAYSAQDLILEPFVGLIFGLTPGGSTQLSGVQHGGTLVGMLLAAAAGSRFGGRNWGSLRRWAQGGCLASALTLSGLAMAAWVGPGWPLKANVFLLGLATGAFSIAAIGSMMRLAGASGPGREGLRMGLWGAAQSIAFALGGVVGTGLSDLARWGLGSPAWAYACVFLLEAVMFVWAARLVQTGETASSPSSSPPSAVRAHAIPTRSVHDVAVLS
ncbi:BCD family MFS transporter [Sphaerotilus mobilis]|uniref:BCD family chlorophyll transporter-like MFS transporter n=1 Tax=Sphaerotilus mobilis TaxID=47994 RepID=A0A4Q7LWP0_9BURK|nr:BCD family MFS transporter [Sphaerotilus mobilis]RZS58548.1 BCD family chlorophyll transporter-like MFS transporter [Sphaerotilus mobilis]